MGGIICFSGSSGCRAIPMRMPMHAAAPAPMPVYARVCSVFGKVRSAIVKPGPALLSGSALACFVQAGLSHLLLPPHTGSMIANTEKPASRD